MLGIHTLVKATDEGYGEYIGEVVGFKLNPAPVYHVKILACIKYPSQNALIFKDHQFKRSPYPYLSQQIFPISTVLLYTGEIPDYEHSVMCAYLQSNEAGGMALCHR